MPWASPWNLRKMQNLRSHHETTKSETLELKASKCSFNKLWVIMMYIVVWEVSQKFLKRKKRSWESCEGAECVCQGSRGILSKKALSSAQATAVIIKMWQGWVGLNPDRQELLLQKKTRFYLLPLSLPELLKAKESGEMIPSMLSSLSFYLKSPITIVSIQIKWDKFRNLSHLIISINW